MKEHSSCKSNFSNIRTFFLDCTKWKEPYTLDTNEAHHLVHVLRVKKGEEVLLLDGKGREGLFRVEHIRKTQVSFSCIDEWSYPEPLHKTILAIGWTKSVRRGWFFEKAIELGVWEICFWKTAYSQYPMPEKSDDTWQGKIIAGAKQCRNPWFPEIKMFPGGMNDLIDYTEAIGCKQRHIFVENSYGLADPISYDILGDDRQSMCVFGAEGGFSSEEQMAFEYSGFSPRTLGDRVLRWETAAILCLGLYWWRSQISKS